MVVRCNFLDERAFKAKERERLAALTSYRLRHGLGASDWTPEMSTLNAAFFPPGSMWFCPWYHDPQEPGASFIRDDKLRAFAEPLKEGHRRFLSIHYWTDWALIRPPICVVCPGGQHWIPDQGSTNGTGWIVKGDPPNLIVSPSIWVAKGEGSPKEYHGWLGCNGAAPGEFSNPV